MNVSTINFLTLILKQEGKTYMSEWHINNQSTKPFLIQQAEKQLSIVKPLPNGSFQILTEIDLEKWQC